MDLKYVHEPSDDKYELKHYKYRYIIEKSGIIYDFVKKRFVIINYNGKETSYPSVRLVAEDGNEYNLMLHKLLATIFINKPLRDDKLYVDHIDGEKSNFKLDNLRWVTASENTKYAFKNGLMGVCYLSRSLNFKKDKRTDETKGLGIINMIMEGYDNESIAKKYNLHSRYISCVRGKSKYKYIWDKYYPYVNPPKSNKEIIRIYNESLCVYPLEIQVEIIEELRNTSNIVLSKKYNLDPSVLSRIRLYKTWDMAHKLHKEKYKVPIPLKYMNQIKVPLQYQIGEKQTHLKYLLYIINEFLKCDINKLQIYDIVKLNKLSHYWCVLYHNLDYNIGVVNKEHILTLSQCLSSLNDESH